MTGTVGVIKSAENEIEKQQELLREAEHTRQTAAWATPLLLISTVALIAIAVVAAVIVFTFISPTMSVGLAFALLGIGFVGMGCGILAIPTALNFFGCLYKIPASSIEMNSRKAEIIKLENKVHQERQL